MRLFLAVEVPKKIKDQIENQLTDIKKLYPQFQWIPKNNYHITIYFFGDVADPKKLIKKLETVLYDKESFYFYSNVLGLFIHNRITVIMDFLREKKIEKINEQIKDLFQRFKSSLKYSPHLTLARYKIPSKQQYFVIKKRLAKVPVDISFKISKLVLFESIPGWDQPTYKKVHVFKLI